MFLENMVGIWIGLRRRTRDFIFIYIPCLLTPLLLSHAKFRLSSRKEYFRLSECSGFVLWKNDRANKNEKNEVISDFGSLLIFLKPKRIFAGSASFSWDDGRRWFKQWWRDVSNSVGWEQFQKSI